MRAMRVLGAPLALLALLALLAVTPASTRFLAESADADPAANEVAVDEGGRSWSPPWWSIARCARSARPLDCVESRSQHAVDAILAQMTEARAARDEIALEPEVVDKVAELSEIVVEAAASVLERRLGLGRALAGQQDDDDAGTELVEEGRGKKKKKIHKLIALVKLVLLVLVVKLKLAFLMMALQTLFQFKLVVMVFLILLCKKISLWAQLKQHKAGNDAQKVIVQHHGRQGLASLLGLGQGQAYAKAGSRSDLEGPASPLPVSLVVPASQVIYYEHAQHQHHYDDHGGWGGGHDEHAESGGGGGGGWGGLWGRSYDTLQQQQQQQAAGSAASSPVSTGSVGVQSGVYRAADGTRIVVRPPDAHDLAYSAQRP